MERNAVKRRLMVLHAAFAVQALRAILCARYFFSVKDAQESGAALSSRWAGLNEKG